MTLRVGLQMDPIADIDITGDTSFALALEAQARGRPGLPATRGGARATNQRDFRVVGLSLLHRQPGEQPAPQALARAQLHLPAL